MQRGVKNAGQPRALKLTDRPVFYKSAKFEIKEAESRSPSGFTSDLLSSLISSREVEREGENTDVRRKPRGVNPE